MLNELADALGYVGSSLDKLGGREIRGLLGGKPRELLSFVPFSDTLGITDEKDITSGRDLLHNAGLVDKNATGWGPGLAGFATEAALDIPSLLSGAGMVKRAATGLSGARNLAKLHGMLNIEKDAGKLAELAAARPHLQGLNRGNYVAAWGPDAENVLKEEVSHGLTKMAAREGNSRGLPLQSRLAAHLYRSGSEKGSPLRFGLGETMLESAGHSARGAGSEFWLNPRAHEYYHGQIGQYSPLAAELYHAAPGAFAGGIGGASAGAASDEDPVRGALLGGLAGAVGGGLISRSALRPHVNENGSFLKQESGAYKHPTLPQNPYDKEARAASQNLEMKTGKPSRFSLDPARARYMALNRQNRYAGRMGGERRPLEQLLGRESGAYDPRAAAFPQNKHWSDLADDFGLAYPPNLSKMVGDLGPENLAELINGQHGIYTLPEVVASMRQRGQRSEVDRALSEIHPDATQLGMGAEAMVLKNPEGYATRISPGHTLLGGPGYRPNLPELVLQPLRSNLYGLNEPSKGLMVEHLPLVNPFTPSPEKPYEMVRQLRNAGKTREAEQVLGTMEGLRNEVKPFGGMLSDMAEAATGGRFTGDTRRGGDLSENTSNLSWFRDPEDALRIIAHDASAIHPTIGPGTNVYEHLSRMLRPPTTGRMPIGPAAEKMMSVDAPGRLRESLARAASEPIAGQGVRLQGSGLRRAERAIEMRRQLDQMMHEYGGLIDPNALQQLPTDSILAALGMYSDV